MRANVNEIENKNNKGIDTKKKRAGSLKRF